MMGTEIFKIDASWAEKWTKTRVSFLSAPTVNHEQDLHLKGKSVEIIFQNTMSSYEDMILVQKSSGAAKR